MLRRKLGRRTVAWMQPTRSRQGMACGLTEMDGVPVLTAHPWFGYHEKQGEMIAATRRSLTVGIRN